jgi:hypothetical protein
MGDRRRPAHYTDDEALAVEREQRFRKRRDRILAGGYDPRLVELLLDREEWDTTRIFKETGVRQQRISVMRRNAREIEGPHPSAFPTNDRIKHRRYGVENGVVEAGRVREWEIMTGRKVFDADTGKLVGLTVPTDDEQEPDIKLGLRHGRARRTPN